MMGKNRKATKAGGSAEQIRFGLNRTSSSRWARPAWSPS
jgi:hypothetical protein